MSVGTFQSGFWRERPALCCAGAALRVQFAQAQNCGPRAQHCRPRAQARTHPPGAGTWRPRLGLAWVSCGLGIVKTAATVPGMATWVFCNRCFQPPRRTACFSLTSCGHVYCAGCLSKCGWGHGRPCCRERGRSLCVRVCRGGAPGHGSGSPLIGGACPQDRDEGTVNWALWWGGKGLHWGFLPSVRGRGGLFQRPTWGWGNTRRVEGAQQGCSVGCVGIHESESTSQLGDGFPGSQLRGPGEGTDTAGVG